MIWLNTIFNSLKEILNQRSFPDGVVENFAWPDITMPDIILTETDNSDVTNAEDSAKHY